MSHAAGSCNLSLPRGSPPSPAAFRGSSRRRTRHKATADTWILLWTGGGMAAPETFDPKRHTPFHIGTIVMLPEFQLVR